jgi:antirestriction protein ArdC
LDRPQHHAATLAHELTHWTRHPSRLNRDLGRKRFGDEGYAVEELVASSKLGSAERKRKLLLSWTCWRMN